MAEEGAVVAVDLLEIGRRVGNAHRWILSIAASRSGRTHELADRYAYCSGGRFCCDCSRDSCRACLMTCVRQPVKPPGPTGEQLLVPVLPTVSSARALFAQASVCCLLPLGRSFSGMRSPSASGRRPQTTT